MNKATDLRERLTQVLAAQERTESAVYAEQLEKLADDLRWRIVETER